MTSLEYALGGLTLALFILNVVNMVKIGRIKLHAQAMEHYIGLAHRNIAIHGIDMRKIAAKVGVSLTEIEK